MGNRHWCVMIGGLALLLACSERTVLTAEEDMAVDASTASTSDESEGTGGSGATGGNTAVADASLPVDAGEMSDGGAVYDCSDDGCENGGTCEDDGSCTCAAGYEGVTCFVNTDDCDGVSCHNGGTCVDAVDSFACSCAEGFLGATCEGATCATSPCQNGASCEDSGGTAAFACTCVSGFSGDACETNIDDCGSVTCINGGTCVDGINEASCSCTGGFAGDTCQVETCAASPCDQGSCNDVTEGFTCGCSTGYSGDRCDVNVNDCVGDPCKNGGSCNDGLDDYSCSCTIGWAGKDCTLAVDDCSPSPCLNSGSCNEVTGAFDSCTCVDGYSGDLCETDINECYGKDCSSHGFCNDLVNDYSCTCDTGYDGDDCETNPNDCEGNGCVNGTCIDGLDAYTCGCTDGFEGDLCDARVDCETLTAPYDGSVDLSDGTLFEDVASYDCDEGYALSGNATRTCGSDAQWSGSPPNCNVDPCAGATIWELTYTLPLLTGDAPNTSSPPADENTIQVLDTPFGAGNGARHIGPGTVTIRVEVADGVPTGNAYLRDLDLAMNFTISVVESQLVSSVTPDLTCGNASDGVLASGTNVLSWTTFTGSAPGPDDPNILGYGSTGILNCTGSAFICGLGGMDQGVNPTTNGPYDVHWQDWTFTDSSLSHFSMPLSIVSEESSNTTSIQLSGNLTSQTCLMAPTCDPQ